MTAQDLKNSILQLAIQGKLVAQRAEEGTAAELYAEIQKEKQKLIKEGKIKKEKPLPEITDDEKPFDIPESWMWVRFGFCGILKSGYAFKSDQYCEKGIQVVRISDLGEDSILTKDAAFYPFSESLNDYIVSNNSFLVCMTGSIGKMAWIKDNELRYLNQRVGMFEPYSSLCISFLWYFLHSANVINQWIEAKTSTNGNIKNSDITELLFPLPPLAEQKRIVAKIEELLPMVEEYGKAQEQLATLNAEFPDKLRKSILQQAVQGKLTERDPSDEPASELLKRIKAEKENLIKSGKIKKEKPLPAITDDEKPFDIPDTWEWVRLSEICSLIGDIDHNMPKPVEESKGVKFLSAKDLLDDGTINFSKNIKYISEADFQRLSQKALPQRNDIIYSRIGAALGKARVVENDIRFLVSYSCCVIRSVKVDSWYLRYFLESPYIMEHTYAARQSIGVPDLGMAEIKNYYIAVPPLAEQKRIVKRVDELLALCEGLK